MHHTLTRRAARALMISYTLAAACGDTTTQSDDLTTAPDALDDGANEVADGVEPEADGSIPGPLLAGAAGDPAAAAVPALDPPDPEQAEVVDVGPILIVRDRLVLALAEGATVGDVNALGAELDVRLIGAVPPLGLLIVAPRKATSDLAWVGASLAHADASPAVALALPSVIEAAQLVPPAHASPAGWDHADDAGADWGLHFIGAQRAWNLRRHLARSTPPRVTVFDGAFNAHPDVAFDAATPLGAGATHGTQVAGVIAARWDAVGIEGVMPVPVTIQGRATRILPYPAETMAAALVNEIGAARQAGVPLVVNMSLGHNLYHITRADDGSLRLDYEYRVDDTIPGIDESFTRIAERVSALLERVSRHTASGVGAYDRWLVVCSAGNSNVNEARRAEAASAGITLRLAAVVARTNSGCGHRAALGDPHFVSVEALATGGEALADFSSRGGTLAAPGQALGLLSGSSYGTADGTSFASPMVAGAAALLWTYHPTASLADIRAALLDGARPSVAASAPRLDLWGSVKKLDEHGGPDLGPLLADVDDRSADGSLRNLPAGGAAPIVTAGDRGDGCVDMADFRAFRDALFDVTAASGYAAFGAVPTAHRDQNGDGLATFAGAGALVEGRHSRFDLDGSGVVDAADLGVLQAAFGSCAPGSGPAVTEGVQATSLPGLLASVDLFLRLPSGSGAVELVAPARARVTVPASDVAARSVGEHLVITLPASSCDGALSLRATRDEIVRTFTTPSGDVVQVGRDYVLDGVVASDVDRSFPLVHTHTGPSVLEAIVYAADGEAQPVDLEPPFLSAPTWGDHLGARHSRAAGPLAGGHVAIATDGLVRSWKIAGTSADLVPVAWSPDAQGLLLSTTVGSRRLYWLDLLREASAEVSPDIGVADDTPQIIDGHVQVMALDGRILRAPLRADGDWSADVSETSTCALSFTLAPVEVAFDLTTLAALRDVSLPRAYPGAFTAKGDRVVAIVGSDLRVIDLDGDDAGRMLTVATGWERRGGFDTFDLDASDGVAWAPDGSLLAYATASGVQLATLGTDVLPDALAAPVKVHDAPAAIAFDPSGTTLVAVTTEGPVSARVARVHVYRAPWGQAAVGVYLHEHRHGAVALSADGSELALVEKDGSAAGNVSVFRPPATTPFYTTATWKDPCGGRACSTTSESMPAWALDVWPW